MPQSKLLRVIQREQCIGCLSCMYSCSRAWFAALTLEKAALRIRNYAGVEGAFSIRVCYGCLDPDCAGACPTQALTLRPGGGVRFDPITCTSCGNCVKACVPKALQWDVEHKQPIVCRHCGICVQFCPNGVIGMTGGDAVSTAAASTATPASPVPTSNPTPAPTTGSKA